MSAAPATASYLDRYDREPAETRWKLIRQFMAEDPLGFFKELRLRRPILVTPECTLLALYDDVIEMLGMPKIFTVALYKPKMKSGYLMSHDDDAVHYREKSFMQSLLNRDDLPKVRQMVASICAAELDKGRGRIDAVGGYCRLVPATLVRDYFGLIGAPLKDLMEWSYWAQVNTFYNQPFDIVEPAERKHIEESFDKSTEMLGKYIAGLVITKTVALKLEWLFKPFRNLWQMFRRSRGGAFQDDIVTRMMRTKLPAETDIDLQRLGLNAGGLLIGTVETTAQATVQAIEFLLNRPDLAEKARNAARQEDTAAFDGIVWEALRFVPISPYMFRQTACEYTIAKGTDRATTIPAATNVLGLTQSAMFDEKAFEEPEAFRSNRNWYHYFTFGYGAHECLGKYVGMVMIPEIVRQLILRPGLAAEGRIVYEGHMPKSYELKWQA